MKKIIVGILLLVLVGGYLYYRSFVSGPKYSLLQAKEAAQAHNMAEFEKYVDVKSLTSSLIDQVAQQQSVISGLVPGLGVAKGALNYLKPTLANAAHSEVKHYIETGEISPAVRSGRKPVLSIAAVAGKIIGDNSEFRGISYIKQSGETALVGLEFTQPKYDTTMVLEIKMIDKGDYWQATELTNTGLLLKHVARLEKQRYLKQ